MKRKGKPLLAVALVSVFLLYFVSEAFLRAAAIANLNPKKVKIDTVLSELPASVQDAVRYRIQRQDLLNDLKNASGEEEKLTATVALALYTKDESERAAIFSRLLEHYPDRIETVAAHAYYLLRENDPKSIPISGFHAYLAKFPQLRQFEIWAAGLNRLKALRTTRKTQLDFLRPLLSMTPGYRDYAILYQEISRIVANFDELAEIERKAEARYDECRQCPSIAEVLAEEDMKRMLKEKEKEGSPKK